MRGVPGLLVFAIGCATPTKPLTNGASPVVVVAAPGPCVDAAADAAMRLAEVTETLGDAPWEQADPPDLDRDGVRDRMFSAGAGVTTNTLVYLVRGACAHFVGDVQQPPVRMPDAPRHAGLLDLEVADSVNCEGARCGCEPGELWFRFDGTVYQLDAGVSKPGSERVCPDDAGP